MSKKPTYNIIKLPYLTMYATGDIHGDFGAITYNIKRLEITNCILFFCGDIGVGFEKEQHYKNIFRKLNTFCKKRNIYCIFIRGNHDDPSYFNNKRINYTNVKFVSDYTIVEVYTAEDINFENEPLYTTLCIGGAISIDRVYRRFIQDGNLLKYKKYHPHETEEQVYKNAPRCVWEDEGAIYCPEILDKIKSDGKNINYICTHTTPQIAPPITKGNNLQYWFNQDTTLAEDLDNERRTMTQIYDKLVADEHPIIAWCYGHFHFHEHTFINTHKFILIDMCRNGIMDIVQVTPF